MGLVEEKPREYLGLPGAGRLKRQGKNFSTRAFARTCPCSHLALRLLAPNCERKKIDLL